PGCVVGRCVGGASAASASAPVVAPSCPSGAQAANRRAGSASSPKNLVCSLIATLSVRVCRIELLERVDARATHGPSSHATSVPPETGRRARPSRRACWPDPCRPFGSMKPIEEQVIVITGASSGIGRCAALHLSGLRGRIGLFARDGAALEEVRDEIERCGGRAVAVAGDVTRPEDLDRLVDAVVGSFGRIDTWVNNAALFLQGRAEQIEPEEYRRIIEVDLLGTILGTRRAIRQMREQGGRGVIIQVSSIVAQRGA